MNRTAETPHEVRPSAGLHKAYGSSGCLVSEARMRLRKSGSFNNALALKRNVSWADLSVQQGADSPECVGEAGHSGGLRRAFPSSCSLASDSGIDLNSTLHINLTESPLRSCLSFGSVDQIAMETPSQKGDGFFDFSALDVIEPHTPDRESSCKETISTQTPKQASRVDVRSSLKQVIATPEMAGNWFDFNFLLNTRLQQLVEQEDEDQAEVEYPDQHEKMTILQETTNLDTSEVSQRMTEKITDSSSPKGWAAGWLAAVQTEVASVWHGLGPNNGGGACSPSNEPGQYDASCRRISSADSIPEHTPGKGADACHILMLANGSRGDVQPLVAVAQLLSARGHRVRILTNADLVRFCLQCGVEALPVFPDCGAVIRSIGGMSGATAVEASQKARKAAAAWLSEHRGACIPVDDAIEEFEPDVIIYSMLSSGPALRYELSIGVPAIPVFFFREALDLFMPLVKLAPPRPAFLATSRILETGTLPKDCDKLYHTGAWVAHDMPVDGDVDAGGPLADLAEFIARGSSPVVVGWGSMLAEGLLPENMLVLALRSLQLAGRRGIIVGGWAQLDQLGFQLIESGTLKGYESAELADIVQFAKKECSFVPSAPHGWLLPKSCCVVHHGGAGTTHAALRSGRPSVVTPVFGDQFISAKRVHELSVGFGFTEALAEISPDRIAQAIHTAETMTSAAEALGPKLVAEAGTQCAAAVLDAFIKSEICSSHWREHFLQVQADRKLMNPPCCED